MNKKKLICILLIVSCIAALFQIQIYAAGVGETFTSGDFTYKVNTDGVSVTLTAIAAEKLTGEVTVPEKVSDGTTEYTVTQLGETFKNKGAKTNDMTSLTLPDTITAFTGTATFYGCKFTSIHLPKNLASEANNAGTLWKTFYFCSKLTEVTLPEGITKCYGTFGGGKDMSASSGVKTVYITGKKEVDFYAGSGTLEARAWKDGTTGITIYYPADGTKPKRTSATGSFSANVVMIGDEPPTPGGDTFEIGDFKYKIMDEDGKKVTVVGFSKSAQKVGAISVPKTISHNDAEYTVAQIEGKAFADATGVTDITIPDTIGYIGYQALMNTGITTFDMPDSVKSLGYGTFYGSNNLTSVKLSNGLEGTLQTTFMYCKKLKSVYVPQGITLLNRTFQYCNELETIIIPKSVNKVDSAGDLFTVTSDARILPDFAFYGPKGSVVEEYANSKGQKYVAIDNDVCITSVKTDGKKATVEVVNNLDKKVDSKVICAFYDRSGKKMYDMKVKDAELKTNGFTYITFDMDTEYDIYNMSCYAYVWADIVDNVPMSDVKITY